MAPKSTKQKEAKSGPPQSNIGLGLQRTLHPAGSTLVQELLRRSSGADVDAQARALVLRMLDGPCATRLKGGGNVTAVKCNGRVNENFHGAWVFNYDQRMSNSLWDELTVVCRGLLVLFPRGALLAEGFAEEALRPGARLDYEQNALLRRLCESEHPCRIFEPMPKFWEGGAGLSGELSWEDVLQACGGQTPRLVRVEEKVDGNLGLLYPQFDDDFRPRFDAPPLLCTKGIAHSEDIERQMRMLSERYPALRLSAEVSHAIVEVVDLEMKVVVPYAEEHTGARLIAALAEDRWLPHDTVDDLALTWAMPRPAARPLPEDGSFHAVKRLAAAYAPEPGELVDEGVVVHLECRPLVEIIRLKVHTHFWHVVHSWWEDHDKAKQRLCVRSLMLMVRDRRFAGREAAIEPCLRKHKGSGKSRRLDDALVLKFRALVALARRSLEESLQSWSAALAATASLSKGLELKAGLDSYLAQQVKLANEQKSALQVSVMRLRGDPKLGMHGPMDAALVTRLPAILRHLYGDVNAPDIGAEDVEMIACMRDESFHSAARKVIEVWADAAQQQWDLEQMALLHDAAPAPATANEKEAPVAGALPGTVQVPVDDTLPLQCMGEVGRDILRQYFSDGPLSARIVKAIDEDGYIVLPGILSPGEADVELARAWDFIETVSPGVNRKDRSTWWPAGQGEPDVWPCAQRDMFQLHQAGWLFSELREKFAARVFEPLYGTGALHVSKDGFTFQRPVDSAPLKRTPNDHFDQGTRWMGLQCIQGSVALTDQSAQDGCFQVWPGSHRLREQLLQGRPTGKGRLDFLILSEQERKYLVHQGIEPRRVPVNRGDVVLWRSDVAHCGGPPLNGCETHRLVAYICCLPAALTPDPVYVQKRLAYEQLRTGGHYPTREEWFEVKPPHQLRDWQPFFREPPKLTERQRQLYGLDCY